MLCAVYSRMFVVMMFLPLDPLCLVPHPNAGSAVHEKGTCTQLR